MINCLSTVLRLIIATFIVIIPIDRFFHHECFIILGKQRLKILPNIEINREFIFLL